jgi:hypothetical protein
VIASITNWVWKRSRSTGSARLALLAIAHDADHEGNAALSVLELAQKSTLGQRTVQMAVRELVRLGEIEVWPQAGDGRRNAYRLTACEGAGSAPSKGAGYAPRHGLEGAGSAPPQDLHPAESAPSKPDTSQATPHEGADPAPFEISDVPISTTGIDEAQVKEASEALARNDVERLCDHLADRIAANGSRRPPVTKRWRDAARLMLDLDGYSEEQVTAAIDWCQKNEFWRANILSMPKLREKYQTLRLQASQNGHRKPVADTQSWVARNLARNAPSTQGELE